MDIALELLKAWGPPGLIAVILWIALAKSEVRENKKDTRIQLLENKLIESYGERIEAADRLAIAFHDNAKVIEGILQSRAK